MFEKPEIEIIKIESEVFATGNVGSIGGETVGGEGGF